jgi:hypothetical protein
MGLRPGGEPLWNVPYNLAIFVTRRVWPQNLATGGSRELPTVMFVIRRPLVH